VLVVIGWEGSRQSSSTGVRSATTTHRSPPCCCQLCTLWHCTHTPSQAPSHCKQRARNTHHSPLHAPPLSAATCTQRHIPVLARGACPCCGAPSADTGVGPLLTRLNPPPLQAIRMRHLQVYLFSTAPSRRYVRFCDGLRSSVGYDVAKARAQTPNMTNPLIAQWLRQLDRHACAHWGMARDPTALDVEGADNTEEEDEGKEEEEEEEEEGRSEQGDSAMTGVYVRPSCSMHRASHCKQRAHNTPPLSTARPSSQRCNVHTASYTGACAAVTRNTRGAVDGNGPTAVVVVVVRFLSPRMRFHERSCER
jgi:hypothetical protein